MAARAGVRDTQIEKDYVISWICYGIANNPFLRENLIFKGGTVLRKVYFPNYRFSEDLDFTFIGKIFDLIAIRSAFMELIDWVREESRITIAMKEETQHETGNFTFYLSYTGPLGGAGANKDIKVDLSYDEIICHIPDRQVIIHQYSDRKNSDNGILCYDLKEVIAEKMRSIMQRTAPRDLYDLWYLLVEEGLDIKDAVYCFHDKAKHKGYEPKDLITVLEKKKQIFTRHWNEHLSDQLTEIPDFEEVWRELGKHWRKFQKFIN
ncbi:MAG: nucleotidyl transferase AbiEii/AbiGii toxin family protein [Bacteroidales bacterium]|nr:nucleotidyl transferase AbiEii/AbiGii toxin family protein [Lentimicrobiaceae bacterium]MDD5695076.1 nucleotidyl transferase AbiEii/AbiGii toxin family protein [Bacteroidales bacterium]